MNPETQTPPTTPPMEVIYADLQQFHRSLPDFTSLPAALASLRVEMEQDLAKLRHAISLRAPAPSRPAKPGMVSDECAAALGSLFIAHCQRSNRLEALCSTSSQRDLLADAACTNLGLTTRAALTTGDIPLPVQYGRELRELISQFGVARAQMSPYPIGLGTAKPPRMGTRPSFGSVAMSAALPDKSPTLGFASLESHKIGGLVRLPRELDEQSIVPMGQFLARYGAIEFARAEDTWAFLADGTPGFEMVKGVVQVARDTFRTVTLAAGKTKPSDATLDDFRALRTKVNKAALSGRTSAYYLDSTWETRLPSFRTQAEPHVYDRRPDGTATLDGYPIIWTDVLEPYGTAAAADKAIAVFGSLQYWWFGEHGHPRMDTSDHVLFVNDQLAVRFIEEIDFDYCAQDATAALLTAGG
ncbi:MAG TPA: phage major capsid protein [Verrucomicrobiae bacterium]|nr:phage major capsid protein [Verrucomicrobiae bacterium]